MERRDVGHTGGTIRDRHPGRRVVSHDQLVRRRRSPEPDARDMDGRGVRNGSGWVSLAAASNAGGPVGPGAFGPAFQLSSVACASPTACIATRGYPGETPDALSWNGTVWSAAALQSVAPGAGLYVQSLSCGSPVTCQAVGFYPRGGGALAPFAESWDGTAWSIQPVPTGAVTSGLEEIQLNGVSCPLAIWCLAVGSQEDSPAAMTYH
jgi:hypothetical protein